MKVEDVSLEPASAFQPFLALQTVSLSRLCRFPSQGTRSGRERMLASRAPASRLEGTPFLFHTFHTDSPPTQGAIKPGGMSVMEMHDHDDDDLPDEVVCAALRAAEFGHSIELMELVEARPQLLKARSRCARRQTLLMEAAHWGRLGVVELLLRRGVEVEARNAQGHTSLMQAAWNGRCCVLTLLLDHGADASLQAVGSGDTCLMLAAKFGHVDAVKLLLRRGCGDVGVVNERGRSALWWAACYGRSEVVRVLLCEGRADPCAPPGPPTQEEGSCVSSWCGGVKEEARRSSAAQVARLYNHHDCADMIEACELPFLLHKARSVLDLPSPSLPTTSPLPPLSQVPPLLHPRVYSGTPLPSLMLEQGQRGEEGQVLDFVLHALPDSLYTELLMHLRPC